MSVRTDVVNLMVTVGGDAAKNELNQLRKKSADISSEMKLLTKNTEEYRKKAAELKSVEVQMSGLRKQIGLTALSQKELVSELRKLEAMKSVATPQTREFKELQKQIDGVKNRLYDVKNGVFGFQSMMHKVGTEIKAFGVMAASYFGIDIILSGLHNIIANGSKVSDLIADIQRVSGLSTAQVKELNQELRSIDTRTGNAQLLEYAKIAGKLGIESKNIAGYVKATDMIVTSLGDELGDATTISENIGKIINIYDKGAAITGERTLQIGNAIVDLANKGVASGGFIVDFTKRLAGIANTANVSLESSIGLAAGLEELGQTSETSSTAVTQVLTKIGADVPKYAKLAGKSVDEFASTLKANPIEALIQLSEGLTKNKNGFAEIAVAFKDAEASGVRVTSTLGVLGQKADFLRGKIADAGVSLKSTSDITEAYKLKNENLGSVVDKISKRLASMFTSSGFMNGLTSALTGFGKLIGAIDKADSTLEQFRKQADKVTSLEKDMMPLIDRIDDLKTKTSLSKTEQLELNKAIQAVGTTIPLAITQFDNYGRAIGLSTEKAREYIRLQQLILKEKNREAISDQKKTVAELEKELAVAQGMLTKFKRDADAHNETMNWLVKAGLTPTKQQQHLTQFFLNGINEAMQNIANLQDRIAGGKGIISELTGSNMDKILDLSIPSPPEANPEKEAEEQAAAAAEEKQAKIDKLRDDNIAKQEALHAKLMEMRVELDAAMKSKDDEEIARIQTKYKKLLEEAKGNAANIALVRQLEADEILHTKVSHWREKEMPARLEMNFESKKMDDEQNKGMLSRLRQAITDAFNLTWDGYQKRKRIKEREKQDAIANTSAMVNSSMNLLGNLDAFINQNENNQLTQELYRNEQRKKSFDKMLKTKQISQQQYEHNVAQMDKDSDQRKRDISRRQAQRQKELAITQAVVNAALGITQIWANYGAYPIVAAALTAIEAVATGIQIAAISNQEIPKGRKGLVIQGPSHEQGGIDMVDTRTNKRIANIEGGEPVMVLSRNTYRNNRDVIDNLIYNSQNRNGAPINPAWSSTYSQMSSNFVQSMSKNSSVGGAGYNMNNELATIMAAMLKEQQKQNEIMAQFPYRFKSTVSLREINKADETMKMLQRESGLKQTKP